MGKNTFNDCYEKTLTTLKSLLPMTEVDAKEYRRVKLSALIKFDIEQYKIEDFGNVCVMRYNLGIMKMLTVVLTPMLKDLPLLSLDFMIIGGTRKFYAEFYDLTHNQDDTYKSWITRYNDIIAKYSSLTDFCAASAWYENLLTSKTYKTFKAVKDDDFMKLYDELLRKYAEQIKEYPKLSGDKKAEKVKQHERDEHLSGNKSNAVNYTINDEHFGEATPKVRYANNVEKMVGLCENPTKSWIDSTRTIVCDKIIGTFREAYEPEKGVGLCDAHNQKKEFQSLYTCLGDSWHFTKDVNTKDLKFEKGKFVKGKVNPKYLYFKDLRDNKIYRAVKIGNQIWMAENMGYETNGSKCSEYCNTDGRLYIWDESKNVCPNGWHLPDSTEWINLFKSVNNSLFALQAKSFRVWPNATDAYDFSLLPAGFILEDNGKNRNGDTRLWLNDRYKKRYVVFGARSGDFSDYAEWGDRYSVRCVKD